MSPAKSPAARKGSAAAFAEASRLVLQHFEQRTGVRSLSPTSRDDAHAAIAIAHCDCFGDVELAVRAVDELIERMAAALPGRGLFDLWIHYLAWTDSGGGAVRRLGGAARRRYRQFVAIQVATALNEATALEERVS